MDFGKIPVDKVAYFVAGVVPGATAVYIYYLANPAAFQAFLAPSFFGYRTKLCIAGAFCFIVGITITMFVRALGGALWGGLWGGIGSYIQSKPQQSPSSAPWRDPTWRRLAKKHLEDNAPDDTIPMTPEDMERRKAALELLPAEEQRAQAEKLNQLQVKLVYDDGMWSSWYAQFNQQMQMQQQMQQQKDFARNFGQGINANVIATAVYLGGSMIFVPVLRNWMCITFVAGSLALVLAQAYASFAGNRNPWIALQSEVEFLVEKTQKGAKAKGPEGEKAD
jgi:hypothetical protein